MSASERASSLLAAARRLRDPGAWDPWPLLMPATVAALRHLLSCPHHPLLIFINWLSETSRINGLMSTHLNGNFGKRG